MQEMIPEEPFERILAQAITRPAGRQFRGEPARQIEILRFLRQAGRPVPFDELHDQLRAQGVLRSERVDDAARRKAIGQAIDAINSKLGTFFFLARDMRLMEEMFRIQVHAADSGRPAYSLQDFFEVRRISGVRFYAATGEPSGGLTRELFELVTDVRPAILDMMAPSFESFFGNPEFRSMLMQTLVTEHARMRLLLLNPETAAATRLEKQERGESALLGGLRERIRATMTHASAIRSALPESCRDRLQVRLADSAPLWRFRMIFMPDVLHLRLSAPGAPGQTFIKLTGTSALYTSLHDVFEQQWGAAAQTG